MARTATTKGGRKPKKTNTASMPNPIYQNANPTEPTTTVEQKLEKFRNSQNKAKSWMWLGVIGISAIIFFFWGWSLMSNISLFSWKQTQENSLVKKTQSDWNEIFTKTEKEEKEKRQLKEQLGVIIDELKKQAGAGQTATSTTGVSSTPKISTTTTSTIR